MYVYECMYVCMYVCMRVYLCMCIYACMHVCAWVYVCMYVRNTYVCMYACTHVRLCIYACMCMYACVYACMYACIHALCNSISTIRRMKALSTECCVNITNTQHTPHLLWPLQASRCVWFRRRQATRRQVCLSMSLRRHQAGDKRDLAVPTRCPARAHAFPALFLAILAILATVPRHVRQSPMPTRSC